MRLVSSPRMIVSAILVTLLIQGLAGAGSTVADDDTGGASCQARLQAGDAAGAESLARITLEQTVLASDEDSLSVSNTLECLVRALCELHPQITDETVEMARQSVDLRERVLGSRDPEVADALTLLAFTLRVRNEIEEARLLLGRSLEIREAGGDEAEVGRVYFALGGLEIAAGDYTAAVAYYENCLEIRRRLLDPHDAELANAMTGLGGCYLRTGRYAQSQPLFTDAIEILKVTKGPDHPKTVETMEYLAISYLYVGDFASAAPLLQETLDHYVARYGPDHPAAARVRGNLGMAYFNLGDFRQCVPLFEASVASYERTLGPDHIRITSALYQLAQARWNLGRYDEALALFGRVVTIRRDALGTDHPEYAKGLMGLGAAEMTLGALDTAREHYETALAIYEATLENDHPELAIALYSYADLLVRRGDLTEARQVLERAVPMHETALGPDHTRLAWALQLYGSVLRRQGEWEAAAPHLERSAAIWEAMDPDHTNLAFAYLQLANLNIHRGDTDTAREQINRGIDILIAAQGEDAPTLTAHYRTSAMLEAQLGNHDLAIDRALSAESISRDQLRLMARTLPEGTLLDFVEARNLGLDVALSVTRAAPTPERVRRVWNAQIDSRAVVLDEMALRRRRLAGGHDPETERLQDELSDLLAELAYLTLTATEGETADDYRARVGSLETRRRNVERTLAIRSQPFREEQARRQPVTVDDLAGALPSGATLIALVRHRLQDVGTGGSRNGIDDAERQVYTALVLPPGGGDPRVVPLGDAMELDRAVLDVRRAMGHDPVKGNPNELAVASAALRVLAWDPIRAALDPSAGIFVVPDGALHLINLAALPGDRAPYLIEEVAFIHDLSAERDLLRSLDGEALSGGMLALGAPSYDADCSSLSADLAGSPPPLRSHGSGNQLRGGRTHCQGFSQLTFAPLPASGREVREVAGLWTQASSGAVGNPPVVLTDEAANEDAFRALGPGREVLHLATHGFFLQGDCGPSSPAGEGDADGATRGIGGMKPSASITQRSESPLLLSGLVLAGANTRLHAAPNSDDGILTAEEIAVLDLRGTRWAVLSACDSGLGDVRRGEGVLGLRRAFRVAGARTVIMSLWAVEDASAREWMGALYRARFGNGDSTAESVRAAAISVIERRRRAGESTHPFYWASFVASGDWR